jgi:hypothetical protein
MPDDPEDNLWADSADRKVAIRALAEHRAEEHLTPVEHDLRRDAARRARTVGELRALFTDLPAPHPLIGEATAAGGAAWAASLARAGGGAGLILSTGGVIVLAALLAGWWVPALLFAGLLIVAAVLVAAGRR